MARSAKAVADKVTGTATKARKSKDATAEKSASTKTTTSSLDELTALAMEGKVLEDERRAETGSQNSFVTLVKANSKVLDPNHSTYMKGVKAMDYVITSKKLKLGAKLDITILGLFKVYAEVKPGETTKEMPKTVGFWPPEQAIQFPMKQGEIFDRELPNGNILQPVHWVFVYLHDFPDIDDAIIAFRSVGNKIYTEQQKFIKNESSICTELRFEVSHQDIFNKNYDKTDYYPKFTLKGRNYKITPSGTMVLDKATGISKEELKEILTRAKTIQEDYKNMRMVAAHNIQQLTGPAPRPALPAGKDSYEEEEEDGNVRF
jgi:hypothetical protein